MSVSGYIDSLFYRLAVEHAIIGRIHIAAVVRPENTARMMIGIETVGFVMIGDAVFYRIDRGCYFCREYSQAISASFESVAVTERKCLEILVAVI